MQDKSTSTVAKALEGWPVGVVLLVVALLCVLIAYPLPSLPDDIPRPVPKWTELTNISELDARRAAELASNRPDFDVRALGEAVRTYGAADADGDKERAGGALRLIAERIPPAIAQGPEVVLKLRAYELSVFLTEVARFEKTGEESAELRELGGGFVAMIQRAGWLVPRGSGHQFLGDRFVREALFRAEVG